MYYLHAAKHFLRSYSHSASQETPCLLWTLKFHHRGHNSPLLVPNLSHMHPVHTLPLYFPKIYSIIFPSTPRSSKRPIQNIACTSHLSHVCYMPCPSYLDLITLIILTMYCKYKVDAENMNAFR